MEDRRSPFIVERGVERRGKQRAAGRDGGLGALEGGGSRTLEAREILNDMEKAPDAPTVPKKGYIRYHRSSREEVH